MQRKHASLGGKVAAEYARLQGTVYRFYFHSRKRCTFIVVSAALDPPLEKTDHGQPTAGNPCRYRRGCLHTVAGFLFQGYTNVVCPRVVNNSDCSS